jgi:hydrogenase expression/formation protein HypE
MNVTSRAPRLVTRRLDLTSGRVDLTHGAGGRAMQQLIEEIFRPSFDNPILARGDDHAAFEVAGGRMVMSTDTFVVSPLFFPGGNIGSLAVHGTVNDVAMSGARPLYLSAGFIVEEGFPFADLKAIARSMGDAASAANVAIVTGDTKVVERGKADGMFVNTAGIGVIPPGIEISGDRARPGDAILISGSVGDHGVAIMAHRAGLEFETTIVSDSAALNGLVADMVAAVPTIRVLRDPTRGGLAATLNEICHQSAAGMRLDEAAIPIKPEVLGACELLGLDPLNVANEGKLVAIAPADDAERLLAVLRRHPLGRDAMVIGEVIADPAHFVRMATRIGGERIVDWLAGEQLPRIC